MALSHGVRHAVREALIWLSLFAIGFVGFTYAPDIIAMAKRDAAIALDHKGARAPGSRARALSAIKGSERQNGFERTVHLRARDNGHFYAKAYIDGRPVDVIVDTGATGIHLTWEDAQRIGLSVMERDFKYRSQTANGIARIALVHLDRVRIGDVEVRNLRATVAERGRLFKTLLGMTFLGRLDRVDIRGHDLVLAQ